MRFFTQKDKLQHYSDVANGKAEVKANSKFSKKEQQAYARGQRDARNENRRIYAIKNSTPLQRAEYSEKRAKERVKYLKNKRG